MCLCAGNHNIGLPMVKSAKISTILCPFAKKKISCCHGSHDACKVSLRSFGILHVKTMFGNKGEGLLHACISSPDIIITASPALQFDAMECLWENLLTSLLHPGKVSPKPTHPVSVPMFACINFYIF